MLSIDASRSLLPRCSRSLVAAGCGERRRRDVRTAGSRSSRPRPRSPTSCATSAATRARGRQILAPNADPHDYEVRPHDVQALADADLVVRSGGDVDEWLDEAIDGSGTDAPVLDARATASGSRATTRTGGRTRATRARRRARSSARLPRPIPAAPPPTGERAAAYTGRLRRARPRRRRAASPRSRRPQRKLVTTHDALGYYAAPLRHRRHRHRDPVALDRGAAVGGRHRRR